MTFFERVVFAVLAFVLLAPTVASLIAIWF
jgi:hypothetical protein